MALLDTVLAIKAGKMKLADVKPTLRKQVQRLLSVTHPTTPATPTFGRRGTGSARFRGTRS